MGSIATYTSDPDAPAVLLEADREYHDSLSDETLEASAKGGPGQSARLRGHGGAGRGGSRGAPGPGRHRALASQVRRALRLLRRRRPRLGTGKAHAGRFHPVLPARHRARTPGGQPRSGDRLTGAGLHLLKERRPSLKRW